MKRRLINESIRDKWAELEIVSFPTENLIYIPVIDMLTHQKNILNVRYTTSYPFRPPRVSYNNSNILMYYGLLSQASNAKINKALMRLSSNKCLCCSTILCQHNWSVTNTIKNILEEFNKFQSIRVRCLEKFWSRMITSRYMVEDIPIFEYL